MNNAIQNLKKEFKKIKEKDLIKSLRSGTTGIGYTFESLLNKKENNLPIPDFEGIEIKTKLGYSKEPITLFSKAPCKKDDFATQYILEKYGYARTNQKEKSLKVNVYYNKNNIIGYRYIFKTKLDKENNKLVLIILDQNLNVLDDKIYWNLTELKQRLEEKLSYLAYIIGYPYCKNNITYYKYQKLKIYKLKNFNCFLELLKKDKIYITFNLEYYRSGEKKGKVHDRGTAFRLESNYIKELFDLIDIA